MIFDSVDKIVQGNTSNIVFLKSTDDSMLDTLQKMSGTTHRSFTDQKTITRDAEKLLMQNEGKVSYTMQTKEVPVISYNDMAFINERNSIVFRAGDSPIWNRNETILPMSWRLFKDTIKKPGKEFSLQTIPTLSSAKDFDVRQNQPNFEFMVDKRVSQAASTFEAVEDYKRAYEISNDDEISRLDSDVYAREIMSIVWQISLEKENMAAAYEDCDDLDCNFDFDVRGYESPGTTDNDEQIIETQRRQNEQAAKDEKKYCLYNGSYLFSDSDFSNGSVQSILERVFVEYSRVVVDITQSNLVSIYEDDDGNLVYNNTVYVECSSNRDTADVQRLNEASKDPMSRTYGDGNLKSNEINKSYRVTSAFLKLLKDNPDWGSLFGNNFVRVINEIFEV